jgi:predicted O-methyltransferase YrrM
MSLDSLHSRRPQNDEAGISTEDAENLYALIMQNKPDIYVEIGTAAGVSTAYVIQAMNEIGNNGKIYAFDCLDHCYYQPQKPIGYAVEEMLDEIHCQLIKKTRAFSLDVGDTVKEPIDFALIDGSHGHPWATLDTIAVLPFLSPGALVAYHDINLPNLTPEGVNSTGPMILFEKISAPKKILEGEYKNLGVVSFEEDRRVYIQELIDLFEMPWTCPVDLEHLASLQKIIGRYYGADFGRAFIDKVLIPRAENCFNGGQVEIATEIFSTITRLDPLHADAFNSLCVCYLGFGNVPMAQRHIQRAIELDPDNALYRENMESLGNLTS